MVAFVRRDWALLAHTPVVRSSGESIALAGSLFDQLRAAIPSWPSEQEREEDLQTHIRVSSLLHRAHEERRRQSTR